MPDAFSIKPTLDSSSAANSPRAIAGAFSALNLAT